MISVEHRTWDHKGETRSYDSARIDVLADGGTVRVAASQYHDGQRTVFLELVGPRGGYRASLAFDEGQWYALRRTVQRAAEHGEAQHLPARWGDLIVEPVIDQPGIFAIGRMGARGNMQTLGAGVDVLWDIAAAVRFCVAEAWR